VPVEYVYTPLKGVSDSVLTHLDIFIKHTIDILPIYFKIYLIYRIWTHFIIYYLILKLNKKDNISSKTSIFQKIQNSTIKIA
jgi:hypothetical protein